jgi:hypothetical protein
MELVADTEMLSASSIDARGANYWCGGGIRTSIPPPTTVTIGTGVILYVGSF